MDTHQRIITAGVFVRLAAGYFPFQVGPTKSGETLGVIRLGSHREGDETGWECAAREAEEEASLSVIPLPPPATYWGCDDWRLQAGSWTFQDEIAPVLVTQRNKDYITPIYLGYSYDKPEPAREAKALLLLHPQDIHTIVSQPMTLKKYLEQGGHAVFQEKLPEHLMLQPFGHLRWLHILLQLHPDICQTVI